MQRSLAAMLAADAVGCSRIRRPRRLPPARSVIRRAPGRFRAAEVVAQGGHRLTINPRLLIGAILGTKKHEHPARTQHREHGRQRHFFK